MNESAKPGPEIGQSTPASTLLDSSPLTAAEVSELWEFVHGDIMVGGIRSSLRASLGLCPRHAWGYAVVEVELWVYGTGPRGGHQPFDVCVLYGDLLGHVVGRLRHRRAATAPLARTLQRRGSCWICTQLGAGTDRRPARRSFAGADAAELAAEAGELTYTAQWLRETRSVWEQRVCPTCSLDRLDVATTRGSAGPVPCLTHLVPGEAPPVDVPALADYLDDVRSRVDVLGRSMRQGAERPSLGQNASWIEALGWFASWHLPLHVLGLNGHAE